MTTQTITSVKKSGKFFIIALEGSDRLRKATAKEVNLNTMIYTSSASERAKVAAQVAESLKPAITTPADDLLYNFTSQQVTYRQEAYSALRLVANGNDLAANVAEDVLRTREMSYSQAAIIVNSKLY